MRFFQLYKFQILKGIYYFSVFFLASGFSYVAFADPPGSAYAPGATLDPSCAPGDTNCTVSSTATASGSDGYLQFNTSGSLASDNGLFWDNTNKRLGVGSSTPSAPLTVVGQVLAGYFTGTTTATSTFGGNLAINGTGTSTSNGGFDISAGCYAINGTCIGAGVSTNSAGGTGAIQFASGTSFAADAANLFWDDTANLFGIGTSTPSSTLTVVGQSSVNPFTVASSTGDTLLSILQNGNMGVGSTTPSAKLSIRGSGTGTSYSFLATDSNNVPHMVLTDSGLFGIGSNMGTPLTRMQVGNGNAITSSPAQLLFGEYSNTAGRPIFLGNWVSPGVWAFGPNSSDSDSVLRVGVTSNYNQPWNADQSAFKIAVGNSIFGSSVGIGTTTPAFALDVNGSAQATTFYAGDGSGSTPTLSFTNSTSSGIYYSSGSGIGVTLSGTGQFSFGSGYLQGAGGNGSPKILRGVGSAATPAYSFKTWSDTGMFAAADDTLSFATLGTERVTIDSAGNLGIGTTTPSFTLDVNGDVNIAAGSAYKYNGSNIITASTTLNNYFFGGAGNLTMTGADNVGSGYQSLNSNTTGYNNTAQGYRSLSSNTTGAGNTAMGNNALVTNTTGNDNVAIGLTAMLFNTSGGGNVAIGRSALSANTNGTGNTAAGHSSLAANVSGMYNVANGLNTLRYNTLGNYNTALGANSLNANTTGIENTAVGHESGYGSLEDHRSVIDTYATFLGYRASRDASVASTTVLTNITAIGQNAKVGASNSMVLGGTGADAVKVGIGTTTPSFTLDVNGDVNIAAGSAYKYNGSNIITASTTLNNYFFGGAGNLTMTGDSNTATGYQALLNNTSGGSNFAVGWRSLLMNTTGDHNTAFGSLALSANTSGEDNFSFGRSTLLYNTTGVGNIAIGYNAGGFGSGPSAPIEVDRSIIDNYSGFIGAESRRSGSVVGLTALENAWAIGYRATVGQSNTLALGASNGVNNFKVGIGTSTPASTLTIAGQGGINPVLVASSTGASLFSILQNGNVGIGTSTPTHTLNVEQSTAGVVARFANSSGYCDIDPTNTALVCTSDATLKKSVTTVGGALNAITSLRGVNFKWLNEDDSTHTHLGVIAQEVEQILPELVATDITTGKKSVNYIGFVPVLIEAVKELASRVSNLEARIAQGVSDGISNISDFVVDTLSAKKVVTETLEMKDSATGETYCVKIANGEWDKTKGACASAPVDTQTASVIDAIVTPPESALSTPSQEEVATSTPEVIENVPDANQDIPPVVEQVPVEDDAPAPQSQDLPEENQNEVTSSGNVTPATDDAVEPQP